MDIKTPRALALRLIMGELLARPGEGPLAPRHFPRPASVRPRAKADDAAGADVAADEKPR